MRYILNDPIIAFNYKIIIQDCPIHPSDRHGPDQIFFFFSERGTNPAIRGKLFQKWPIFGFHYVWVKNHDVHWDDHIKKKQIKSGLKQYSITFKLIFITVFYYIFHHDMIIIVLLWWSLIFTNSFAISVVVNGEMLSSANLFYSKTKLLSVRQNDKIFIPNLMK